MEPVKWSALALCLQKSQVDIVNAVSEKEEQTIRAAAAERGVTRLHSIIQASGSDNMRQIVALQTENDVQRESILWRNREIRALEDDYDRLQQDYERLRTRFQHVQQDSDFYCQSWAAAARQKDKLVASENHLRTCLERTHKSRAKAQRRLYALRAQVRKECDKILATFEDVCAAHKKKIADLKKQLKTRRLSRGRQILVNMKLKVRKQH